MTTSTFPRKVVVSPGHRSGSLYDWTYAMREDQSFIDLVESGCNDPEVWASLMGEGFDVPYTESDDQLKVVVVDGPYIVQEYDGHEYVTQRDNITWRD